jgi:hypothetical protein
LSLKIKDKIKKGKKGRVIDDDVEHHPPQKKKKGKKEKKRGDYNYKAKCSVRQ